MKKIIPQGKYSRNTIHARQYWSTRWKCECGKANHNFEMKCENCGACKPRQTNMHEFLEWKGKGVEID